MDIMFDNLRAASDGEARFMCISISIDVKIIIFVFMYFIFIYYLFLFFRLLWSVCDIFVIIILVYIFLIIFGAFKNVGERFVKFGLCRVVETNDAETISRHVYYIKIYLECTTKCNSFKITLYVLITYIYQILKKNYFFRNSLCKWSNFSFT